MKKIQETKPMTQQVKKGFTMVELSLTLAFIAMLLITIAIITTNIVTIYQKGLTVKAVNSVGRGLIDEFTSAINTAPSVDTVSLCKNMLANDDTNAVERCTKNKAFDYIFHASQDKEGRQLNGIFCTGRYSYVWNTYYGLEAGQVNTLRYREAGMDTNDSKLIDDIHLIRVEDPNYRVCSTVMTNSYQSTYGESNELNITRQRSVVDGNGVLYNVPKPSTHMLDQFDELALELYELTIFPITQDAMTLRTYMSGTFILATSRGNIDIQRSGDYCQPDQTYDEMGNLIEGDSSSINNLGSEFNYCAINKFNFAARTAGV